ncbi:MAG: maleylacetoacetate isomerase [Oligoflexia bacterium]|nr:maleylacetoacetate isomerase [Oligoflexia bacterium]
MSSLTLYSYYRSSSAYRVRIAFYFKQIEFHYQPVHLLKKGGEQFQDFFKGINPLSQVPCLKHKDKILTQSLPILLYLEELQPEPALLPKDSFQKAEVLSFCEWINSGIQPLQNLSVLKYIENEIQFDKVRWSQYWIERGLTACEEFLKNKAGSFCFSNQVTLADLFLIPQLYNANRFQVDIKQFPLLDKINRNCLAMGYFQKALPENQPDAPQLK